MSSRILQAPQVIPFTRKMLCLYVCQWRKYLAGCPRGLFVFLEIFPEGFSAQVVTLYLRYFLSCSSWSRPDRAITRTVFVFQDLWPRYSHLILIRMGNILEGYISFISEDVQHTNTRNSLSSQLDPVTN